MQLKLELSSSVCSFTLASSDYIDNLKCSHFCKDILERLCWVFILIRLGRSCLIIYWWWIHVYLPSMGKEHKTAWTD